MYEDEDLQEIHEDIIELNEDISTLRRDLDNISASIEGSGENVTLSQTVEARFKKPPLPMGNSEQEEIFYIETTIKKGFIDSEGNVRADSNLAVMTDYIPVFPNTLYNINRSISTSYTNIRFFDNNKNFLGTDSTEGIMTSDKNNNRMLANETSLSMTILNNNVAFMVFNDYSNDLNTTYTISTLSPSPDYPQEITNVTGDVEVVVGNKNLIDYTTVEATPNTTVQLIDNGFKATGKYAGKIVIENLKPNTNYYLQYIRENIIGSTVSVVVFAGTSQSTTIASIQNPSYFNTGENTTINIWFYVFAGAIDGEANFTNIQLEESTTPTNYVAHKEQTFTFPLGNEKLMLGDYLADDGIHKNRKKIVLDGTSENKFSSFSTGANNRGAIAAFSDIKKGVDFRYNTALCTNFAYVPNVYFDSGDIEGFIVDSTGTIYVRFGSQSEINTLAKANQWLANTLPELEYELAEETIIPYTPAQQTAYNQIKQAISYDEQTNVSSNTIALFEVKAFRNMNTSIESLQSRIELLKGRS